MRIETAKKIFKLFREKPETFFGFFKMDSKKHKDLYDKFLENYENILLYHGQKSFKDTSSSSKGQTTITNTILKYVLFPQEVIHGLRGDERSYFINGKYFRRPEITLWVSLGIDPDSIMTKWRESKPKPNDEIDGYYQDCIESGAMSFHEVFADRYKKWEDRRPLYKYQVIADMDNIHIKNIIDGKYTDEYYEEIFLEELKHRGTSVEQIKKEEEEAKKKPTSFTDYFSHYVNTSNGSKYMTYLANNVVAIDDEI